MYSTAADEDVSGRFQGCWHVDVRSSVGGSFDRLQAGYFKSELVASSCPLQAFLGLRCGLVAEERAGDSQTFAVHHIRWGRADVGLKRRTDGKESARKTPEPIGWLIVAEGY